MELDNFDTPTFSSLPAKLGIHVDDILYFIIIIIILYLTNHTQAKLPT